MESAVLEANAAELSAVQVAKLENLEVVIQDGLKSFIEVGRCLMEIRDERLYRATHSTFEDYCQERWDMTRRYANMLVAAADVVDDLGTTVPAPTSEAQCRPLARLPEEERVSAWKEAVAAANGKPTAAIVEEVVSKRLPEREEPEDDKPTKKDTSAKAMAEREAREFLESFHAWVAKLCDGGVYTYEDLVKATGICKTSIAWFIRMCDVSPSVKVHRNAGRKNLIQYSFEATHAVTAHARIKQLAEKIVKDDAATGKIHSAASEILSLLGG